MGTTFVILTALSILSILVVYIIEKLILKKKVSFKNIFIPISISAIISFISSFILGIIFYKLQRLDQIYLIPLIASILFILLSFVLYKTKSKFRNSFIATITTILVTILYIYVTFSGNSQKFSFLINRTAVPFEKVNNKIQNTYILLLKNETNNQQEISLKVLDEDIKLIQPKSKIQIEANQKRKVNLLLESNPKNVKYISVSIEASNSSTKVIRKSIFIYK